MSALRLAALLLAASLAAAGCSSDEEPAPPAPEPEPVSVVWSTDLPVSVLESTAVGDSKLKEVQGILSDLGATRTAEGIVITVPDVVLFDFDKANIRADARPTLEKIAKVIKFYKDAPVRVEGHTDAVGSPQYNKGLSERRANAVKQWLTTQGGIPGSRKLDARGFGESRPVAPNRNPDGSDNPAGRQKNRRVEVIIGAR